MMTKCAASSYGGGWYKMNIIGAGKEWVKSAAEKMFNEIPIVFEKTISADTVAQSWEWEDPVRFFRCKETVMKRCRTRLTAVSGYSRSATITPLSM